MASAFKWEGKIPFNRYVEFSVTKPEYDERLAAEIQWNKGWLYLNYNILGYGFLFGMYDSEPQNQH